MPSDQSNSNVQKKEKKKTRNTSTELPPSYLPPRQPTNPNGKVKFSKSPKNEKSKSTSNKRESSKSERSQSNGFRTAPKPKSLAEFNPNKKKSMKVPSVTILETIGEVLNLVEDEKEEVKELDEDQEAKQRKIKLAQDRSIPLYRNVDKQVDEGTANSPESSESGSPEFSSTEKSVSIEECSDGFNNAEYIKHLISDLNSPSTEEIATESSEAKTSQDSQDEQSKRPSLDVDEEDHLEKSGRNRHPSEVFDSQVLGTDQEEFDSSKFKSMVRRFFPSEVKLPGREKLITHPRQPRAINCTGATCNWGVCSCLKMYMFTILVVCTVIFLNDKCFLLSNISEGIPVKATTKVSGFVPNATNETNRWIRVRAIDQQSLSELISSSTIISTTSPPLNDYHNNSGTSECPYKWCRLCLILFGLIVYLTTYIIYSCEVVLYYYDYINWFFWETILTLLFNIPLLIFSVSSPLLSWILVNFDSYKPIPDALLLINSLFGLILSLITYRMHSYDEDPLNQLDNTYNPDMDGIVNILHRKQWLKLFTLGKRNDTEAAIQQQETTSPSGD